METDIAPWFYEKLKKEGKLPEGKLPKSITVGKMEAKMRMRDYCIIDSYDGRCGVDCDINVNGNCSKPRDLGLCNDCQDNDQQCATRRNRVASCDNYSPQDLVKQLNKKIGG